MTNKRFLVLLGWPRSSLVLALAQAIPDTAKDPVCGMTVKTAGAKYTLDYKGTTYYFCSEGCKTSFSKSPEKYLKPTDVTKPMGRNDGQARDEAEDDGAAYADGRRRTGAIGWPTAR